MQDFEDGNKHFIKKCYLRQFAKPASGAFRTRYKSPASIVLQIHLKPINAKTNEEGTEFTTDTTIFFDK